MKKGDKITVVVTALDLKDMADSMGFALTGTPRIVHTFRQGTVRSRAGGRITYDWMWRISGSGTDTVAYADRGTVWARGWEGPEVDALKVSVALT